jgi:hypothetical protein
MVKAIQIGSTCQMSVSNVSFAVTRLPSDLSERLDNPVIGAFTRCSRD